MPPFEQTGILTLSCPSIKSCHHAQFDDDTILPAAAPRRGPLRHTEARGRGVQCVVRGHCADTADEGTRARRMGHERRHAAGSDRASPGSRTPHKLA
jgi:hypothetical protein